MRISYWSSDVCSSDLEGLLVWMEVDSILRQQSGGKKSIDDFAHAFFGMRDGESGVLTYTLDDVVATLNGIQPYDWAGFLNECLNDKSTTATLAGCTNNGHKMVHNDAQLGSHTLRERGSSYQSLSMMHVPIN